MPIFFRACCDLRKENLFAGIIQVCIIYRSLQIQLPVDNSVFIASNDIPGLGNLFFQICDVIERVNRQARTFKESLQWSDTTISNVRLHDLFFLFVCFFVWFVCSFFLIKTKKKIQHLVDNSVFIARNEILDKENLFFHYLLCLKRNSFGKAIQGKVSVVIYHDK